MVVTVELVSETTKLSSRESNSLLFMASVKAPSNQSFHQSAMKRNHAPSASGSRCNTGFSLTELNVTPQPLADVCCLEGCGLGWRVRPPLRRRGPWTVMAQRMRLCVEALGSAKIEKVYTLHDHHELTPRVSYEVSVGDLHAGDVCHIPVLVWLPQLHVPAAHMEVVRFTLIYMDAMKIDTKSCDVCATISRPAVPPRSPAPPPVSTLRERCVHLLTRSA